MTGDLFTARFSNCNFVETIFPPLGGENKHLKKEVTWNKLSLCHLNPRTRQCNLEVQKIIHLLDIINQLPDAFIPKESYKISSHIPVTYASNSNWGSKRTTY